MSKDEKEKNADTAMGLSEPYDAVGGPSLGSLFGKEEQTTGPSKPIEGDMLKQTESDDDMSLSAPYDIRGKYDENKQKYPKREFETAHQVDTGKRDMQAPEKRASGLPSELLPSPVKFDPTRFGSAKRDFYSQLSYQDPVEK